MDQNCEIKIQLPDGRTLLWLVEGEESERVARVVEGELGWSPEEVN